MSLCEVQAPDSPPFRLWMTCNRVSRKKLNSTGGLNSMNPLKASMQNLTLT